MESCSPAALKFKPFLLGMFVRKPCDRFLSAETVTIVPQISPALGLKESMSFSKQIIKA